MSYWTYTYQHSGPEYYDTEMDREFLLDLREIRGLLDKEKEIKQWVPPRSKSIDRKQMQIQNFFLNSSLVLIRLKSVLLERAYTELDLNFK